MLPPEVVLLIGRTSKPVTIEVEKGAIRKFADAVGDFNPLYWDEEYAQGTKFGTIVAPPGFFGWPTRWKTSMPMHSELLQELIDTCARVGYSRAVAGGVEFDFYHPVRAGDVLISISKITDFNEREGKIKMIIATIETTYTTKRREIIAKVRMSSIQMH